MLRWKEKLEADNAMLKRNIRNLNKLEMELYPAKGGKMDKWVVDYCPNCDREEMHDYETSNLRYCTICNVLTRRLYDDTWEIYDPDFEERKIQEQQ